MSTFNFILLIFSIILAGALTGVVKYIVVKKRPSIFIIDELFANNQIPRRIDNNYYIPSIDKVIETFKLLDD